jgi:predicted restriction endonuclease
MKTRGSAQRAFANAVKSNYGYRCAITGIESRDFLVASHIVPWSEDQRIRLDPSNGICLSVLMDRAFETGHLLIGDDLSIRINWPKVGNDGVLRSQLAPYDGQKLRHPKAGAARPAYLRRRRALAA